MFRALIKGAFLASILDFGELRLFFKSIFAQKMSSPFTSLPQHIIFLDISIWISSFLGSFNHDHFDLPQNRFFLFLCKKFLASQVYWIFILSNALSFIEQRTLDSFNLTENLNTNRVEASSNSTSGNGKTAFLHFHSHENFPILLARDESIFGLRRTRFHHDYSIYYLYSLEFNQQTKCDLFSHIHFEVHGLEIEPNAAWRSFPYHQRLWLCVNRT